MMKFKNITIDLIYKKDNVREEGEADLADLAESINRYDMLQPILVRPVGDRFEIISGHRRFLAMKISGANQVPCIIRDDIDEKDRIYIQLIENTHRIQMSAMDLVETFDRMKAETPGLTNAEIARRLGRSVSWVANQYGAARYAEKMAGIPKDQARTLTDGQIRSRAYKAGLFGMWKQNRHVKIATKGNVVRVTCSNAEVREQLLESINARFPDQEAAPRP
jgi:ParB/RepB/Spo0J family partition protein